MLRSVLVLLVCLSSRAMAQTECEDQLIEGEPWHDDGGPKYSCVWYAYGTRCSRYGKKYEGFGISALDACCACGGGVFPQDVEAGIITEVAERVVSPFDFNPVVVTLRLGNIKFDDIGPTEINDISQAMTDSLLEEGQVTNVLDASFVSVNYRPQVVMSPLGQWTVGRDTREVTTYAITVEVSYPGLTNMMAFKKRLLRNMKNGIMRKNFKGVPGLTRLKGLSMASPLYGPACLDMCGISNEVYENDEACFCALDCELMNDCCPSFYLVPCTAS